MKLEIKVMEVGCGEHEARCLSLPGCAARGASAVEAIKNLLLRARQSLGTEQFDQGHHELIEVS